MKAFLAAMLAMVAISVAAYWTLDRGPLAGIAADGPDAAVRLD
jgi:hypothetical protein